jgi:Holliday junction resolvasome RuvABC endonuclease subunit
VSLASNDSEVVEIMAILGIDPSLTSTGFAFRARKAGEGMTVVGHIRGDQMRGMGRLVKVEERLVDLLDRVQPKRVVFEGYAMGIRSGMHRAFDLGELGGVLKKAIWERGIDLLLVPPTVLKKFAVGAGNAKKEEVFDHLTETSGLRFQNTDEADAYGLLLLGEAHYGGKPVDGVAEVKGRPIRIT